MRIYRNNESFHDIKKATFPAGEKFVRLSEVGAILGASALTIDFEFATDELLDLALVYDALARLAPGVPLHLRIPYFPYARQDRVCEPGEPLSVKVVAEFINALKFKTVTTLDVHSDVATALLSNCNHVPVEALLLKTGLDFSEYNIVAPDAGAAKKAMKVAKQFGHNRVVFAHKMRDTRTGEIKGIKISNPEDLAYDLPCLVVDDICDGGRTFVELAGALRRYTSLPLSLWVTHGIFSKGAGVLFDAGYARVYTTTSYYSPALDLSSGQKVIAFDWRTLV